ncbi:TPA: DUF551 domain-containing protein [Citrobacter freundii]
MTTNNHPAQGPVSLERLHQIREILSKAAAQSDGGNLGYAMDDAVKVIGGAISAFGAEPVGYFYADKPGDWYQISDTNRVPEHRRIPLYSNPQSGLVVKLPNEFISSDGIVVQIEKLMAVLAVHGIQYERKDNACSASMLQSFNNSEQLDEVGSWNNHLNTPTSQAGYSPVTPDGWIPVSERMPPNKPGSYEYIVFDSLNNKAHHDYWNVPDGSCDDFSPFWNHYGKYVTHWMPLAAAPQQEVK